MQVVRLLSAFMRSQKKWLVSSRKPGNYDLDIDIALLPNGPKAPAFQFSFPAGSHLLALVVQRQNCFGVRTGKRTFEHSPDFAVLLGLVLIVHHSRFNQATFICRYDEKPRIVDLENFASVVGVHASHGGDGEGVISDSCQLRQRQQGLDSIPMICARIVVMSSGGS